MFVVKEGLGLSSVFSSHEGEPVAAASTWWKQQLQHQHQRFRSLSSSTGFASLTASSSNSAPVSPHSSSSFVPPLPRGKKESRTGTDFPADYCHIVKKACPVLTGVGVRSKRLLGLKNVDVYSLGFYVDPSTLSLRHNNKNSSNDSNDISDAFVAKVAADPAVAKTLRVIVTTSMLNAPRFLKGVRESLAPVLAKAGASKSLEAFEALFEGLSLNKGTEIVFSNVPSSSGAGGALRVKVGGKEVGAVSDARFAPALFGLYFGPDSVSPSGRDDIRSGIARGFGGGREGGSREE